MGTTDAVKDNVYARTRDAVNFFYKVEMSGNQLGYRPGRKRPTPFVMNKCRTSRGWPGAQAAIVTSRPHLPRRESARAGYKKNLNIENIEK